MSARKWKPGEVGIASSGERFFVTRDGECAWESMSGDNIVSSTPMETDRPLVVIDPEDREQVERLVSSYCNETGSNDGHEDLPDAMQAALRSLIAREKPEEPIGLGAVVVDADGDLHVRTSGVVVNPWRRVVDGTNRNYGSIAAIKVLSEGVRP